MLLPFALTSVVADVTERSTPHLVITRPPMAPPVDAVRSRVHLTVTALNEWENTVTVRVALHQSCDRACPWGDRYLFVSAYGDSADGRAAQPSSEAVTLPATAHDVTQTIKLPLYGDAIRYPYDRYQLTLGIIIDRLFPDGSTRTLTPAEARDYATVTLQARVPRAVMTAPARVDPTTIDTDDPGDPYLSVQALTFERPIYLRELTVLLVLLVTAAAAYAVFMRPLDQLIINSGALILGVWGIRSILLGTGVPGFTLVDLALAVVILFLLVTIAARTLWLLEERSRLRLLRRRSVAAASVSASPSSAAAALPEHVPSREPRVHRNGGGALPD